MRQSKSPFKRTLEGRGIYPSFPTLFVRGLSLSCFCTHSDALYQLFEAGVRSWRARLASFARVPFVWPGICGDQGATKPRGKLITVLLAAEGRGSAVETKHSSRQLCRLFLEPDSGLASLTRFCINNILTISKSARQVLSKGFW